MNKKFINIDKTVVLGKNVKIENQVVIKGKSFIGDDCVIKNGSVIIDSSIGKNCIIENSKIDNSILNNDCIIGPYANIRPNCVVGDNVKVGAFVELKNSIIGKKTKIAHLAYIGDAELGENVNVGCGVVFANYDGKNKKFSKIGNEVFIGCNVNIVAPVNIADKTYICAGTTVTNDTEIGDFVIGRVRQENKKRH